MSNPNFGDEAAVEDNQVVQVDGPTSDVDSEAGNEAGNEAADVPDDVDAEVGTGPLVQDEPIQDEPVQDEPVQDEPVQDDTSVDTEIDQAEADARNTEETDTEVEGPLVGEAHARPQNYVVTLPEINYAQAEKLLSGDARNRALRSFLQGLAFDVVVALVLLLGPVVAGWNSWEDIQWKIIGFSVVKTLVVTILSYIMRRFADAGIIPTPKPPVVTGNVVDPNETGNRDDSVG